MIIQVTARTLGKLFLSGVIVFSSWCEYSFAFKSHFKMILRSAILTIDQSIAGALTRVLSSGLEIVLQRIMTDNILPGYIRLRTPYNL